MGTHEDAVLLSVTGDSDLFERHSKWLAMADFRRASTETDLRATLDDTVDVVTLDQTTANVSSDSLFATIDEQNLDCLVLLVTPVEPGIESIERGFDAYCTRQGGRESFVETVEQLIERTAVDDEMRTYYSLQARRAALQAAFDEATLSDHEGYRTLLEEIEAHETAVDESLGDMESDTDFVGAVREITGDDAAEGLPPEDIETETPTVEELAEDDSPTVEQVTDDIEEDME